MKKTINVKKIGEIFENLLQEEKKAHKSSYQTEEKKEYWQFVSLIKHWEDIVGKKSSEHTIPSKLERGNLTIIADHPAYSSIVSFIEDAIKKKILELFPTLGAKIQKIVYITNQEFFIKEKEAKSILVKKNELFNDGKKKTQAPKDKNSILIHQHSPLYKSLKQEAEENLKNIENNEIKHNLISIYIQCALNKRRP